MLQYQYCMYVTTHWAVFNKVLFLFQHYDDKLCLKTNLLIELDGRPIFFFFFYK